MSIDSSKWKKKFSQRLTTELFRGDVGSWRSGDCESLKEEIEKRKERAIEELDDNSWERFENDAHRLIGGIDYIFKCSLFDQDFFHESGSDALLTLFELFVTATHTHVKSATTLRASILTNLLTAELKKGDLLACINDGKIVKEGDWLPLLSSIYVLERLGVSVNFKAEFRKAIEATPLCDLFNHMVNGKLEPNHLEAKKGARKGKVLPIEDLFHIQQITELITASYYAKHTGINIKAPLETMLSIIPRFRPYFRSSHDVPEEYLEDGLNDRNGAYFNYFSDVVTFIYIGLMAISCYGELGLDPALVPMEASYMADPNTMAYCVQMEDVHTVGMVCHSLKVLGFDQDEYQPLVDGVNFLRRKQKDNGAWSARMDDPYTVYHAASCAISGLSSSRFRGFAPTGASQLLHMLMEQRLVTRKGSESWPSGLEASKLYGIFVKPLDENDSSERIAAENKEVQESLNSMRALYESKGQSTEHEYNKKAADAGIKRLQILLRVKNVRRARKDESQVYTELE
jgi:hypothetical protein